MRSFQIVALTLAVSVPLTLLASSALFPKSSTPKKKKRPSESEIVNEQLARNIAFLGKEGVQKIRNTHVAVVGCGGVGSWVATMLVRNGVGKLTIIDFDQVSLSSLNRHACATLEDVGSPKVDCLKNFLERVCPWVEINAHNVLFTTNQVALLHGADYVVDCIDNMDTKLDLLTHCHRSNINVISSMGAGCKGDPTRVQLADISNTSEDPLSRQVRIKLRARGIAHGIPTVFSSEKPGRDKAKILSLDETLLAEGNVNELSVLQRFRVCILPVLGPMPAIFGLTIATHLLTLIGGYHSVYDPVDGGFPLAGKFRTKLYEKAHLSLVGQLARLNRKEARETALTIDDIAYLLEEVWKGKTIGGQCNRLVLSVWDPAKKINVHNVVPMTKEQQHRHEESVLKAGEPLDSVWTKDELEQVSQRQGLDKWYTRING